MTVTIARRRDDLADQQRNCGTSGLVRSERLFKLYCWVTHAERTIEPGTYSLNSRYDYHALVSNMVRRPAPTALSCDRSPSPKATSARISSRLLEENGVCSYRGSGERRVEPMNIDYAFLAGDPLRQRKPAGGLSLPGYLPVLYGRRPGERAWTNSCAASTARSPATCYDALDALNDRTLRQRMAAERLHRQRRSRMQSFRHATTSSSVASLVEKETARGVRERERSPPSSITASAASSIRACEIDATHPVCAGRAQGRSCRTRTRAFISPYNTYKNAGLPAGPIANPGIECPSVPRFIPAESDVLFHALGNDRCASLLARRITSIRTSSNEPERGRRRSGYQQDRYGR